MSKKKFLGQFWMETLEDMENHINGVHIVAK